MKKGSTAATVIIAVLIIIILVVLIYLITSRRSDNSTDTVIDTNTTAKVEDTSSSIEESDEPEIIYDYSASLKDVTDGKIIRGTNTGGNSSGTAQADFNSVEGYKLKAVFENLPDPQGNEFYEGWIVRQGSDMDVLSSGVAEKENGQYVNTFSSDTDLTDHDFYVLTLEPDDGDPAPADHILEGTLTK